MPSEKGKGKDKEKGNKGMEELAAKVADHEARLAALEAGQSAAEVTPAI